MSGTEKLIWLAENRQRLGGLQEALDEWGRLHPPAPPTPALTLPQCMEAILRAAVGPNDRQLRTLRFCAEMLEAQYDDEEDEMTKPKLLALRDVAELLGITYSNVKVRRHRGLLPPPDWTVGGRPLWEERTIVAWQRRVR